MGNSLTIDNLVIQVDTNASKAQRGLSGLVSTLERLKATVGSSSTIVKGLNDLSVALDKLSKVGKIKMSGNISQLQKLSDFSANLSTSNMGAVAENINSMSQALEKLSSLPKGNLSSIASGISSIVSVAKSISGNDFSEFSVATGSLAVSLKNLSSVRASGFTSIISALKKLPQITEALDDKSITAFGDAIRKLVTALQPLAEQMDMVAKGFASLPTYMQRAIKASTNVAKSTDKVKNSYNSLLTRLTKAAAKFYVLYQTVNRIVRVFAEAFNTSNEYIESLNLFKVSMEDAGGAAMDYAEKVSVAMGIDISEWITNQGMFQRMATGFGVASKEATLMSQNLTQLAYDMSSFFNIDVETAMDKLASGMSGQIKGLKALGYNLSVAALQETAYAIGIEKSVRSMSEAERAQLRYITLIRTSKGVMGDMAKTITTPANALRILNAQITQLERAFGDIVSVLLVKVIPYVQAFVKLMTEAARTLATTLGFTIKDLPSNNLEAATDIIEDLENGVEDAGDSLSELKKQMMGFDELNILHAPSTPIIDTNELMGEALNFDLPSYDFLGGLDSSYGEKIDKIADAFERLFKTLENFIPVGIAAFALFEIKQISKMEKMQKVMGALSGVVGKFSESFKETGNIFKTFGKSLGGASQTISNFAKNLSPLTKGIITIAGLATEFSVVSDAAYDLAKGTDNVAGSLLSIVGVSAAVGAAMYTMLGPWGLVAAAVTGVIAALKGVITAQQEAAKEALNAKFYDGVGVSIYKVADAYKAYMDAITDGKDDLIASAENISSIKSSVADTAGNIETLATKMELGYATIKETVPLIKDEFDALYKDTYDVLFKEQELIYDALAGSAGRALEALGYNLEEIGLLINSVVNDTTVEMERLKKENEKLLESIASGEVDAGTGMEQYLENINKIAKISGTDLDKSSEAIKKYQETLTELLAGGINFEDSEAVNTALSTMSTASDEAKAVVEEYYGGFIDALTDMQSRAKTEAERNKIGKIIQKSMEIKNSEIAKIDSATKSVLSQIFSQMRDYVDENATYENATFWDKFVSGLMGKNPHLSSKQMWEANGGPQKMMKDILQPIISAMEQNFSDLLPENVYDKLFEDGYTMGDNITAGVSEGLMSTDEVVANAKNMANSVINASRDTFRINSPSKVMKEQGLFVVQGLADGISENAYLVTTAFDSMLTYMEERMTGFNIKLGQFAKAPSMSYNTKFGLRGASNDGLAKAVYEGVMAANEDSRVGGESKIVLMLDGEKVGEASVRYINGQIVQTGTSPIYK